MARMKVAVCAITFQRPEGLQRLLRGLDSLTFPEGPPELYVVIVDNDPDESARNVCDGLRSEMRWPLNYHAEPRRGIPFARNKAVACAVDDSDFIAFLDDDEVPEPNWLDELLRVQRQYDADVVTGPVVPHFPDGVPRWVVKGGFFASPRCPSGRSMDVAFTHNVLARSAVFKTMEVLFDERLAMTGGSDSHFFRRVHRAGYSIVWADDAVVSEWIPQSRACFGWLVRRSYRVGNTRALVSLELGSWWWTGMVLCAKAVVWVLLGILLAPLGLLLGRHVLLRAVRYMAYGVGTLLSISGGRYEEYRTIHGK